jgi:hypothetical protein
MQPRPCGYVFAEPDFEALPDEPAAAGAALGLTAFGFEPPPSPPDDDEPDESPEVEEVEPDVLLPPFARESVR